MKTKEKAARKRRVRRLTNGLLALALLVLAAGLFIVAGAITYTQTNGEWLAGVGALIALLSVPVISPRPEPRPVRLSVRNPALRTMAAGALLVLGRKPHPRRDVRDIYAIPTEWPS